MEKEDAVAGRHVVDKGLAGLLRGPRRMVCLRAVVGLGEDDQTVLVQTLGTPCGWILHPVELKSALSQSRQSVPRQRGRVGAVVAKDKGAQFLFAFFLSARDGELRTS